jgi:hypothetical protein
MNFVKDYFRAISSEVLKMKRTLALWLVIVAPLSVILLQFLVVVRPSFNFRAGMVPWLQLTNNIISLWALLMLPLFVTLESALVSNLEHGEKQWKHLFALPVSRQAIYLAKLTVNFSLIALSSLLLWLVGIGSGYLLHLLRPSLGFGTSAPWVGMFQKVALVYLAVWLIIALHTWISLRWPSVVLAIGIGMTATVAGFLIANSGRWAKFYPWTLQINVIANNSANLRIAIIWSVIGALVIGAFGCWEMTRRDAA